MSEKIHYKLVHDFDREVEVNIVKSRFLENKETAYFMSSSIGLVDELSNFQTINGMDRKISKLEAQLKEANQVIKFYGEAENWLSIHVGYGDKVAIHRKDLSDHENDSDGVNVGGKLACEYLEKYKEQLK